MPGSVLRTVHLPVDGSSFAEATLAGVPAGRRLVVLTAGWIDYLGPAAAPSQVYTIPELAWREDARGAVAGIGNADQGQQVSVWSAEVPTGQDYWLRVDWPGNVYGNVVALEVGGLVSGAALDRTASAGAADRSDLTPTAGPTAALAQADEWVVGVLGATTGSSSADINAALASGWTRAFYEGDPYTRCAIAVDWRNVSSTAAVTASWGTVATHADAWSAAVATYKATGGAPQGPAVNAPAAGITLATVVGATPASVGATNPPPAPAPAAPEEGRHLRAAHVSGGARGLRAAAAGGRLLGAAPPNVAAPGTAPPGETQAEPVYAGASEVFFDDFAGTALDRAKWRVVYGGEGTGHQADFIWDAACISVSGGVCTIRTFWDGSRWRTGGFSEGNTALQWAGRTHGQISVRARVQAGKGFGPAFLLWPASNEWTNEIDILEAPSPTKQSGWNVVHGNPPDTVQNGEEFSCDLTRWHIHTCRWQGDKIEFYLDGAPLRTVSDILVSQPMAIGLQGFVAAAGHEWYGGAPNDYADKLIEIDWVRWSQVPASGGGGTGGGGGGGAAAPQPVALSAGSGARSLVLYVSQDAYNGSARYAVSVDGVRIGPEFDAVAWKSSGLSDTVTLKGDWAAGEHTAAVDFLNDDYGGSASADRNLYVDGAALDGAAVPNSALSLLSQGVQSFKFTVPSATGGGGGETPGATVYAVHGVFIGNDAVDLPPFEQWLGKQVDAVLAFTNEEGGWNDVDPGWQLGAQYLGGTGRRIVWTIPQFPESLGLQGLRDAAAGAFDATWRDWATKCLNNRSGDAGPIYLRTFWELGGEWYPWTGWAQSEPQTMIDALRRWYTVWKGVSPRFQVCYDFEGDRTGAETWFPGAAYCDVLCQDLYWQVPWFGETSSAAWNYMRTRVRGIDWMTAFNRDVAGNKPIAVPEWGVPAGYDASGYIASMKQWMSDAGVLFHCYWNSDSAYKGKLSDNRDAASSSAYKQHYGPGAAAIVAKNAPGGGGSTGGGTGGGGGGTTSPSTPHLSLTSEHGHAVVNSQDGARADVRLVRPIYPYTEVMSVNVHNSAAQPSKAVYWGDNPRGYLAVQNGRLSINRELLSTDDGAYDSQLYQEMTDGSVLRLDLRLSVSPSATGAAPAPTPVAAVDSKVFLEDFAPRTGTGALWSSYGAIRNAGDGTVIIEGVGSANQPFTGKDACFPNGMFEYVSYYIGENIGDGSGPCQLLWPADDLWPGTEIDLGELMADGTFYVAAHRAKNGIPGSIGTSNDEARIYAPKDNSEIAPGGVFNHQARHSIGAFLQNDRITFFVDGKVLAVHTEWGAPDARNGGVNHGFGILCNSTNRGLRVDRLRYTPEAMVGDLTKFSFLT